MALLQRLLCSAYLLNIVLSQPRQDICFVTLSQNPVYSGQPVTVTCSYPSGTLLLSAEIEAFNGTQRMGFFWCKVPTHITTTAGVLKGHECQGCPEFAAGSTNVTLSLTASSSLAIDFNCTTQVIDENGNFMALRSCKTSLIVLELESTSKTMLFSLVEEESSTTILLFALGVLVGAVLTIATCFIGTTRKQWLLKFFKRSKLLKTHEVLRNA